MSEPRKLDVSEPLLGRNDALAARNRADFRSRGMLVMNVLSSPGSGKTALLEATIARLDDPSMAAVIVGDLATDNDARRLSGHGAAVTQIETDGVCHLDAEMVWTAAPRVLSDAVRLLIIENVGNLVCPSNFDLGEDLRVVLLSVTEGEDKPLKYPVMFSTADLVIITKSDLAEATGFDRPTALANVRKVAPRAEIIELSARTGAGMEAWMDYLTKRLAS
jgi:hydrogenase nickel incorporation protein HypB